MVTKMVTSILLANSLLLISMKQAARLERTMRQRTEDSLQLMTSKEWGPQFNNLRETESCQQPCEWTWRQILSQLNLLWEGTKSGMTYDAILVMSPLLMESCEGLWANTVIVACERPLKHWTQSSMPQFWPTETKVIYVCSFKPLNLVVICNSAIDD